MQYKDENLFNYVSTAQLKSLEKQGVEFGDLEKKIQKGITIASILDQLRNKSIKLLTSKEQQKVIVAGLDQAGKTAILTTFGGQLGIEDLSRLAPTKKVDRQMIETEDTVMFVWDFGGQTIYREEYLRNPGAYFIDVNLLLYVIDVQDYKRFDESFKYLKAILNALKTLEEVPHLLIFIHKFDPDLRDDPDILLNVEFVKENLKELLINTNLDYEIYLTSIYSVISKEPRFSKYLKELVAQKDLIADPTSDKIEELGKIISNALNAIIRLSESVATQYDEMDRRFHNIEEKFNLFSRISPSDAAKSAVSLTGIAQPAVTNLSDIVMRHNAQPPPSGPPAISGVPPTTPRLSSQTSIRSTILGELKELFTKSKQLKRY